MGLLCLVKDRSVAPRAHARLGLGGVAILALVLLTSCLSRQSVWLTVDRAEVTHDAADYTAIHVFLAEDSKRKFADFTTKAVGRIVEIRFADKTLAIVVVREPHWGGQFQISASAKGPLTNDNIDEIARKLGMGGTMLEAVLRDDLK